VGRILGPGLSGDQIQAAIDDARGGAYGVRADDLAAVLAAPATT
jgi:hypothetical protein